MSSPDTAGAPDPLDCDGSLGHEETRPADEVVLHEVVLQEALTHPKDRLDKLALLQAFDREAERAVRDMDSSARSQLEAGVYGLDGPQNTGGSSLRVDLQTFRARVCGISPQAYSDCQYGRKGSDGTVLRWISAWQNFRWLDDGGSSRSLPDIDVNRVLAAGGISTSVPGVVVD